MDHHSDLNILAGFATVAATVSKAATPKMASPLQQRGPPPPQRGPPPPPRGPPPPKRDHAGGDGSSIHSFSSTRPSFDTNTSVRSLSICDSQASSQARFFTSRRGVPLFPHDPTVKCDKATRRIDIPTYGQAAKGCPAAHHDVNPLKLNDSSESSSDNTSRLDKRVSSLDKVNCVKAPEKPPSTFTCSECPAAFTRKGNLKKHVRSIHLNIRPHACEQCGVSFPQKSSLETHVKLVHLGQRPFQCAICSTAFGLAGDLNRHVQTVHEKKRPHKCVTCNASFGLKNQLNKHIKIVHEKVKPFACETCGSAFGESSTLKKHRRIHEK
mmetsp:Transcript_9661/g.25327  ORF Transcript_9661/g.25327 Transcript_9661/m.25327 type:complete len:325 (-) Transcript_9661:149-1123(-)